MSCCGQPKSVWLINAATSPIAIRLKMESFLLKSLPASPSIERCVSMRLRRGSLVNPVQAHKRQQHHENNCIDSYVQAKVDQAMHADAQNSQTCAEGGSSLKAAKIVYGKASRPEELDHEPGKNRHSKNSGAGQQLEIVIVGLLRSQHPGSVVKRRDRCPVAT